MSLVMVITMVLCFALSVSVAVSIGLSAIFGMVVNDANMLISVKEMFNSINKFPLAAIPFFILAGNVMETGGISRRDRKSTRLNSSHPRLSRMPSSA